MIKQYNPTEILFRANFWKQVLITVGVCWLFCAEVFAKAGDKMLIKVKVS